MGATDANPQPIKNKTYRATFPIRDSTGLPILSGAGLDAIYSIDAASPLYTASNPVEIGTTMGMYYLDLTAGEMNGDTVAIVATASNAGTRGTPIVLYTSAVSIGELQTTAIATIVNAVHATPNWGNASATMTLKSLTVINSGGDAVSLQSTGSNGRALFATGNGTGAAMHWQGGTTAPGLTVTGGPTNASGIAATGQGTGKGVNLQGGATGEGLNIIGGANGNGAVIQGQGSGHGLFVTADAGRAVWLAGINERGLYVTSEASIVPAAMEVAAFDGVGMVIRGGTVSTVKDGVQIYGGAPDGHAIKLIPGSTGRSVQWIVRELTQATPSATPASLDEVAMMTWTGTRNQVVVDSTAGATVLKFHNDAGTVIFKKSISDDGTTYTESEAVAGP